MFGKYAKSLPVVMHHFVSGYPGLSMTPELFEENCDVMTKHGWRGISLEEAETFLLKKRPLPKKSFLLTLDDGYLDNYVYAWPILRKYGHHGVVFAVADYVSESSAACSGAGPRPTLQEVWDGKLAEDGLPDVNNPVSDNPLGYATRSDSFFTWAEARAMEASGVMAVAGHSLRHAAVYTSGQHSGFRKPGDNVIPFNREVKGDFWGCPLFTRGPELGHQAFLPDQKLVEVIKKLVPQDEIGAAAFFESKDHIRELEALLASFKGQLGHFESEEEQKQRIGGIMSSSQAILQKELGHPVKSFCWPWGVKNAVAMQAGLEACFEVFYNVSRGPNPAGNNLEVQRFKAKRRQGKWLLSRSRIYSHPLIGKLYSGVRI